MDSTEIARGTLFDMANSFGYIETLKSKLRTVDSEIVTLTRLRNMMSGNLRISAQRHLNEALALQESLSKELRAYRGEA